MQPRRSDRRDARVSFRWPERRSGFDRRSPSAVAGALRSDERLIAAVLGLLFALGFADWALTAHALAYGLAWEANPIMRAAFEAGPVYALVLRVSTLGAVVAGMWLLRKHRSVILLAMGSTALHVVLVGYHLAGATLLSA